jgi:hypothetical protein
MNHQENDRSRVSQDGDLLLFPFQCDLCHFQNIQHCMLGSGAYDEFFQVCIGRANLGASWARERSMVESNQGEGKHTKRVSKTF